MNQSLIDGIIAALRELFRSRGRTWREVRGGLAVPYRDGDEIAFVNRRTIEQTSDFPTEPVAAAEILAARFELEDERRSRVLNGLRHLFVRRKIAFRRRCSGKWQLQSKRIIAEELCVSGFLTQLVGQFEPAEALIKFAQMNWLGKVGPRLAAKLTSRTAPPERELPWDGEYEGPELSVDPVKLLTIDYSPVLDGSAQPASREEFKDVVTRSRNLPGIEVVRRLCDRLGQDKLQSTIPFCNTRADFDFSDGLDHLAVVPRGKRLARQIRDQGIDVVVEDLVQQYCRLDSARERFLAAIRQVMAARGFVLDYGFGSWWFGRTHREHELDPGRPLTLKLKRRRWEDVLVKQLRVWQISEIPAADDLTSLADGPISIVERGLPATEPGTAPSVPDLKEFDVEQLDDLASQAIARLKRDIEAQPDDSFEMWTDPTYYRRGSDDWTDEAWWVSIAQRVWAKQPLFVPAAILIANGVKGVRERLSIENPEFVAGAYDFSESQLLWVVMDDPWKLAVDGNELPDWFFQLGSPPPEMAWKTAAEVRAELAVGRQRSDDVPYPDDWVIATMSELDAVAAREWLTHAEIEAVHEACRRWACSNDADRFSDGEMTQLDVAMRQGWGDVLELLDRNPVFLAKLLEGTFSDIPPSLGRLAMRLSAGGRSELSARFAAKILTLDVDQDAAMRTTLLVNSFQAARAKFPSVAPSIPSDENEILAGQKQGVLTDQCFAGIAWHRWRRTTATDS